MSEVYSVVIDFSEAGLDYDRADLERFLLQIAHEMESGKLVESARLAREEDIPESAKSGLGAFLTEILMTDIPFEKLWNVMGYLGHLFYGKTVTLKVEDIEIEYNPNNPQQLERALDAAEQLTNLRIKLLEAKTENS